MLSMQAASFSAHDFCGAREGGAHATPLGKAAPIGKIFYFHWAGSHNAYDQICNSDDSQSSQRSA